MAGNHHPPERCAVPTFTLLRTLFALSMALSQKKDHQNFAGIEKFIIPSSLISSRRFERRELRLVGTPLMIFKQLHVRFGDLSHIIVKRIE
jgi:hypothetical protein